MVGTGHWVPGTGTTSEVWPILIFGSGQGEENCWNLPIKQRIGGRWRLERMVESDMVHHQTPSLASWEPSLLGREGRIMGQPGQIT